MRYMLALLFIASVPVGASDLDAVQAQTAAAHVRNVAHELHTRPVFGLLEAGNILQQVGGVYTEAQQNAIADTLVAVALSAASRAETDAESMSRALRAVETLVFATLGERGTPYRGGAERLLRLAMSKMPTGAVTWLHKLPDRAQALDYLRQVAIADTPSSLDAVYQLRHFMGAEGMKILEELYRKDLVVVRTTRCRLAGLALRQGWMTENDQQRRQYHCY